MFPRFVLSPWSSVAAKVCIPALGAEDALLM